VMLADRARIGLVAGMLVCVVIHQQMEIDG
jgi:hypothetical protein